MVVGNGLYWSKIRLVLGELIVSRSYPFPLLFGSLRDYTLTFSVYNLLKLNRGDPVIEEEYDRSCVGCELRRIHRQADEVCITF